MKVILLSSEFPPGPGGIGTHAFELASGFTNLGLQVYVLSPQDYATKGQISAFNKAAGFKIRSLKHCRLSLLEGLYRLVILMVAMLHWKPDALIASGERSAWLAAAATRVIRKPWLAVVHGSEYNTRIRLEKRLTTWAFKQASRCIAVSDFTRQVLSRNGVPTRKIQVIPNGANAKEFSEPEMGITDDLRLKACLFKGQKLLLTVGNLTRRKGQDVVIRAIPLIVKAGWDVHYFIVGLPTLKREMIDLADQNHVMDRVHILGSLDRASVIRAYRECDIFLMTSRMTPDGDFEGYGIAAVEAALAGKPAIVSHSGGLPEAVLDQVTGIIVPEDDPISTAKAVVKLLENPQFAENLGQRGRERALTEGLWKHRVAEYYRSLTSIIHQ